MKPRVSIVIPAYNEGEAIIDCLDRIFEAVTLPCEVVVVFDHLDDATVPYLHKYSTTEPRLRPVLNDRAPGPANAIRVGVERADADVVVVTMADGCDDPQQIDQLTRLVNRGVVIAAGSRYARGGQQVGGPVLKGFLSRLAGVSLHYLARVGTRDATNSFKAYSTAFVREVGIESDGGFELALELVAKAKRLRLPVAELPTIWLDRSTGVSNFKLLAWIPNYIKWWMFAFGPRLEVEQVRSKGTQRKQTV